MTSSRLYVQFPTLRASSTGSPLGPTGTARIAAGLLACLALGLAPQRLPAQTSPAATRVAAAELPPTRSALDANLFYQLLVAEAELRRGETSAAYQLVLEAARRTRDEALFRRAVDIALRSRSSDQALSAAKAWRTTLPRSALAAQTQAQVLLALGRTPEAAEPLRAMIELTAPSERPEAIALLPRLLPRGEQARAGSGLLDDVLKTWREGATRTSALVAGARAFAGAGDTARALQLASDAQRDDAAAEGPALIAIELMKEPGAEAVIQRYLKAEKDTRQSNPIRLAYVRQLTSAQRYTEAAAQLGELTQAEPGFAAAWLTLGALQIELNQPRDAQASLQRFLALRETRTQPPGDEDEDDEAAQRAADDAQQEVTQAYLMLAQAAEQQRDFATAQSWLEKLGDVGGSGTVISRRASLLARQGKLVEARELIRGLPDTTPQEARSKLMSESQLLREAHEWTAAHELLATANKRFPDDPDLLYEQAMMAEKLDRFDDMERLLRKVIELRPDFHHAYNALGYSLADRNLRLPEARQLVVRALELAPGDPFITDSLGWVEFRLGKRDEAVRLLRDAYGKRPDPEIAAHLGEVLWASGLHDDARRIWREARERDAANDVLKETLARLKVSL